MTTVSEIADAIRAVGEKLKNQMNSIGWSNTDPFSTIVGDAGISVSANTVAGYAEIVALRIERLTKQQLDTDKFGIWLGNVVQGLNSLNFNSINQGHYSQFSNAINILQMIDAAIPSLPPKEPKVNWEDLRDQKSLLPRDLSTRLRSIDARLSELEPRSKDIAKKISDIENAHSAADQLPTDLAELAEKRVELSELITSARELAEQVKKDSEIVGDAKVRFEVDIKLTEDKISKTSDHAERVLAKSEHALRGATAVGLAKAFEARKKSLSNAGMWWPIGLAVALITALGIGWERVNTLKEVLTGDKSSTIIIVNAILAIIGIGAPVWFAWLSTKQIGTTFRLAEDYAFKASVAQAYEGYRIEATDIDEEMRTRLFSAALDRFEEAPIRLVDPSYHSSPLDEALSNPNMRSALNRVPDLAAKLLALIPAKAGTVAAIAVPATMAAAALANDDEELDDDEALEVTGREQ